MIRSLKIIEDFGQFHDFCWNANLPEFGKYNFIYGWNYSGKTTLSRIFRALEIKELHRDFSGSKFTISSSNNDITHLDLQNIGIQVKVFSEDFIEKNFEWNNENAEIDPILILGEDSNKLEKELSATVEKKEKQEKLKAKKEQEKEKKEEEFRNKYQSKATEIRNILSITNPRDFDRNELEKLTNSMKDTYNNSILNHKILETKISTYRSKKLDLITLLTINLGLNNYFNDVMQIMKSKITVQKIIEKLEKEPRLSDWVQEGLDIHKNEAICQFCLNELKSERIKELQQHFSEEFYKLMNKIENLAEKIKIHLSEIEKISLPDKARLYDEYKSDYQQLLNKFKNTQELYINQINALLEKLRQKKESPFEALEIASPINPDIQKEMETIINEIQKLIEKHNDKSNNIDKEKLKAKDDIAKHFSATFIENEKIFDMKTMLESLNLEIREMAESITTIKDDIEILKNNIKESAVGVKTLNEYLTVFFGDDRLRIEQTESGRYKLYRNDEIAKNLSTGERNIISLIYFFAKLEETSFNIGTAVIFIDDPVSSLDSNHMHRVYAFLSSRIEEMGQIFITTHNFDFFNLLKDLYKYDLENRNGSFYLIKKIKHNEDCFSTLEVLPKLLREYKSEYNYLFYILSEYQKTISKPEFKQLYILPNILRRFFELYLFMRYPDGNKYKKKCEKYFSDICKEEINSKICALKIMDEYSHEENIEHSLKFPDLKELDDSIDFILETINKKDKDHYKALSDSIT